MAKEFPPSDVLGTLNLFDGLTPVVAPDGHHVFYKKGTASPLFARSLDGDITNNPEESLVTGCVMVFGIVPTARGIYYVACHDQANPLALRYFEFASRRSFDVPQVSGDVRRDKRRAAPHAGHAPADANNGQKSQPSPT